MFSLKGLCAAAGCLAVAGAALAQNPVPAPQAPSPAPLLRHTFEESEHGWTTMGGGAVRIVHEPADVHGGNAALQYDYTVTKGEASALLVSMPEGVPAGTKSVGLWLKCDVAAPLALMLQERDGARYVAGFTLPKGQWQEVRLGLGDFALSDMKDDPPDANNRLDIDQVVGVGLVDLGQWLVQADNADLLRMLHVVAGPRRLDVDDFELTSAPLPPAFRVSGAELRVEGFSRPQVSWMVLGDARAAAINGAPLAGRGVRLTYSQAPGNVAAMFRMVPQRLLAGVESIAFTAACTKPTRLLVQLEERGGGKYNALVEVPGGSAAQKVSVRLADMAPDNESRDNNGRLDPDQVKSIAIIDPTGIVGGGDGENSLWVGPPATQAGS